MFCALSLLLQSCDSFSLVYDLRLFLFLLFLVFLLCSGSSCLVCLLIHFHLSPALLCLPLSPPFSSLFRCLFLLLYFFLLLSSSFATLHCLSLLLLICLCTDPCLTCPSQLLSYIAPAALLPLTPLFHLHSYRVIISSLAPSLHTGSLSFSYVPP